MSYYTPDVGFLTMYLFVGPILLYPLQAALRGSTSRSILEPILMAATSRS
jgi:hypothetical protein